jgi:hypothetical protein
MKTAMKFWLAGLGSAVVGAVVGALTVGIFMGWFMRYGYWVQARALGATQLAALSSLRAGDTDKAANVLELSLDSAVMVLGAELEDMPEAQRADAVALFRKVRTYRIQHGVQSRYAPVEATLNQFAGQAN